MQGDSLELADDRLFIEKIQRQFQSTDADQLIRAYQLYEQRAGGPDSHALQAAELLLGQGADAATLACALIAPLYWRGLTSAAEVQECLGPRVAHLIRDLVPPFPLRAGTTAYQRESIHSLLVSISGDPRKALLLITFRLLALENAHDPGQAETRRLAQETRDFYLPIANRLSLGELCRRLEDICFWILNPSGYEQLKLHITPIHTEDNKCLDLLLVGMQRLLESNSIQGRIQGRTKSLYSIHCKAVRRGMSLHEIMDRIGLRVIVASVPECYAVLGLLHTHFKPIPGTFDDYIGLPKNNGYQSLHTCVYPVRDVSHKPIEFQVRTELMHAEAEYGTAAHWRYKTQDQIQEKDNQDARWIKELVHQHDRAHTTDDFIERLHQQVFQGHLVVFGKGGRINRLPEGSTVQDYLNKSQSNCVQPITVKVNGKEVDFNYRLKDGDSLEVVTNDV
jgi:GTP pyrophosphokinase